MISLPITAEAYPVTPSGGLPVVGLSFQFPLDKLNISIHEVNFAGFSCVSGKNHCEPHHMYKLSPTIFIV